jgi:CIC family chloride channel protein
MGYTTINDIFHGAFDFKDLVILLILKIVFFTFFLSAGGYGGTFTPSLSIGALLGSSFAMLMNMIFHTTLDPLAFALVGMGGVLAGFNSIPLTAIMLVFEVTNDYKFILPLMLVSVISYLVTIYYNKMNIQSLELMRQGIDVTKRGEMDLLAKVKVRELMKTDFDQVNYNIRFRELLKVLLDAKYGDVFVVDDNDKLIGIISLKDVRQALVDNELVDLLIARDVSMPVPTVLEDDPVSLAIRKIEKYNIENIPVIKSESDRKIVGVLTYHDIIRAYDQMIRNWQNNEYLVDY